MNSVRVLSVKSAVSENRVQCSFLTDRSLSNISISYIYIYLIIWTVCVFCQWRVLLVKTEFSIHYLVTGACLNILTLMWMEIISLSYLYVEAYVIDVVCDSYIGILGSHKNIISTLPGS